MLRFNRAITWLRRIGHGRGFGVQSPNDYRFLRNVINEHLPYYKYEDLRKAVPCKDRHSRKMCQLYFRLSNYAQADFFLDFQDKDDGMREFVLAACSATRPLDTHSFSSRLSDEWRDKNFFVRCACSKEDASLLHGLLALCGERSIIVVEGIHHGKEEEWIWERIFVDTRVTIAYDLYHCGILLLESRRYKKRYYVNY